MAYGACLQENKYSLNQFIEGCVLILFTICNALLSLGTFYCTRHFLRTFYVFFREVARENTIGKRVPLIIVAIWYITLIMSK